MLAFVWLTVSGCGSDAPRPISVQGKITLAGGPWPKDGELFFTPVMAAEGFPKRPGMAKFDTDGNFVATTLNPDDGLLPGKYKVAVECWEVAPTMAPNAPPPIGFAAAKFQSAQTSGLEVDVPADSSGITVQFDAARRKGK